MPLRDGDGRALGTLCVIDRVPRDLTAQQQHQLTRLAARTEELLRLRRRGLDASAPLGEGATEPGGGDAAVLSGAGSGRPRVLVVDDEQGLCEIAASWLESLGYEAVWVLSPEEALARLAAERFDVLFTDVVMPGAMDGIALGRLAKQRDSQIRVLLASGYARSLLEGGVLPGALLNKPYRRKDLATAFAALLGDQVAPALP